MIERHMDGQPMFFTEKPQRHPFFNIKGVLAEYDSGDGKLNPDFVEALMGFPRGWTRPDCETEVGWRPDWFVYRDRLIVRDIPVLCEPRDHRVNRLKALGNAVVPQVAEFVGSLIVKLENRMYPDE